MDATIEQLATGNAAARDLRRVHDPHFDAMVTDYRTGEQGSVEIT